MHTHTHTHTSTRVLRGNSSAKWNEWTNKQTSKQTKQIQQNVHSCRKFFIVQRIHTKEKGGGRRRVRWDRYCFKVVTIVCNVHTTCGNDETFHKQNFFSSPLWIEKKQAWTVTLITRYAFARAKQTGKHTANDCFPFHLFICCRMFLLRSSERKRNRSKNRFSLFK